MFTTIADFQQSQMDRLEDAGVIKYGALSNSMPKTQKVTMRSRVMRQVRQALHYNRR